jgi:hypothetical protein
MHLHLKNVVSIKEWCGKNTKRIKFVEIIPLSLFELFNKCVCESLTKDRCRSST